MLQSYYPEATEEEAEVIVEKGGDDLTKLPAESSTVFSSFDEAKAAIDGGFTGKYSVGGKAYKTADPEYPDITYLQVCYLMMRVMNLILKMHLQLTLVKVVLLKNQVQ